jgi:hypothetical protein
MNRLELSSRVWENAVKEDEEAFLFAEEFEVESELRLSLSLSLSFVIIIIHVWSLGVDSVSHYKHDTLREENSTLTLSLPKASEEFEYIRMCSFFDLKNRERATHSRYSPLCCVRAKI